MKYIRRYRRWRRARKFQKAYIILRKEYDQHKEAGHFVTFTASSPTHISFNCIGCPREHPLKGE